MSDIATLANHIVLPRAPEPAAVDQNPSAPSQNTNAFTPDSSRPLDAQQPLTTTRRNDDDTAATTTGPESGTENFSDVLEKRLSQKSDSHLGSKESPKPKQTPEAPLATDKPAPKQKPALLIHLANTAPGRPADPDQLKPSQTKGAPTMPSHHVTVALPGKGATKTNVKAKGNATGQTHLLSKAQSDTKGSTQGQPVQAEQLKTDAPAADVGPTLAKGSGSGAKSNAAKNHKAPISNNKPATDRAQTQLPAAGTTTKKPAPDIDTQLNQTKNTDILDENPKTDELLATAKLSHTDNTNTKGILPAGTKGAQTPQGKNQTPAASDSAQSATQKDTSDVQAAIAATSTNAVVADTDGSNPAAVIADALGTKASNVPSALTAHQTNSADGVSPTAAGPSTGGISAAGNIQQSPAQQIIDSIRLNFDTPQPQINITLNPPELGRVRIMFQQIDGEITGLLEAEKRQTKYEIAKSIPQIVASLQECGVQVRKINVLLNEQNQQQAQSKNNDVPDGDFAGMTKHGFTNQSSDGNPTRTNSTQADAARPITQQSSNIANEITEDTINVYV